MSKIQISNTASTGQFLIGLTSIDSSTTGIGKYYIAPGAVSCFYTETWSGGQAYTINTGIINITACSTSNVTGTFTLSLVGGKTVTGTINASQPEVQ